jgi:hypothetical protein
MRLAMAQPCLGSSENGPEDEEVESALDEIAWLTHTMIIYNKKCR